MARKIKLLILSIAVFFTSAYASNIDDCYKIYPQEPDILFMSAISALSSSNKFNLSEIQSKNGYILFAQGQKFYLLTLTKKYKNQTEIKILPQNSDYTNAIDVAKSVFASIDNKLKYPKMEQVK